MHEVTGESPQLLAHVHKLGLQAFAQSAAGQTVQTTYLAPLFPTKQ